MQKGAYPYKYMNDWEKFNETSLSQKDITNVDNTHTKRVCKEFEKKNRRISWFVW